MLLALVGLSLTLWFSIYPDPNLPEAADKVFPYFIATHLPTGLAGLMLAALLAATVSSMTSGINTLAASITFDFRSRFGAIPNKESELRFGRFCSVAVGLAATASAGLVGNLGTIFDITQTLLGLFAGPLCACILLSLVRFRVSAVAISLGLVLGTLAGGVVAFSPWTSLWVAPMSFVVALATGLLGTIAIPKTNQAVT